MAVSRLTDGAGNYLTTSGGDYLVYPNLEGCEVSDGWRVLIELFYDPDAAARRYGALNYGDGFYGDVDGMPSVERWVDVTKWCRYTTVTRGNINPEVDQNTDDLNVELVDTLGEVFAWQGDLSLSGPQFNTPLRVSMISPDDGVKHVVSTGRLDDISENFNSQTRYERVINLHAYGQKTSLITSVLARQYSRQTVADRISEVLLDIDYQDTVSAYPAEFSSIFLRADAEERVQNDAIAYVIISQAAASAGYSIGTSAEGAITWVDLADPDDPPTFTTGECEGPGIDVVYTSAQYRAGIDRVLNVVQLQNTVDPAASAEGIDAASVSRFGRRSEGFGFPIVVANDFQADAQAIADGIVQLTGGIINRCADFTFDTTIDATWYELFTGLDISTVIEVVRSHPYDSTFTGRLIGIDFEVIPFVGVTATVHLSTRELS